MIRFDGITIDRHRRCIEREGMCCVLPRMHFRFACALLLAGPKGALELFDLIYGDDSEGGPLDQRVAHIFICQLRPQLAAIGIAIHTERYGRNGQTNRYWAAPCEDAWLEAAE